MFYTRRGGSICLQWFVLFVVTFYLSWYLVSKPNHPCIRACFALSLWFKCDTQATSPLLMAWLARRGGGLWYRHTACRARMITEDNDMSQGFVTAGGFTGTETALQATFADTMYRTQRKLTGFGSNRKLIYSLYFPSIILIIPSDIWVFKASCFVIMITERHTERLFHTICSWNLKESLLSC